MKRFGMIFALAAAACGDAGEPDGFADPRVDRLLEPCQCEYSVYSEAYDLEGNRLPAQDVSITWEPVEVSRLDCRISGAVSARKELVRVGEDVVTVNFSDFQRGMCVD